MNRRQLDIAAAPIVRARTRLLVMGLAVVSGLLALPALAAAEFRPFGHACKAQSGVRFCPTVSLSERVPSFDGVPLDADVTLPPAGQNSAHPLPTIVIIHGWEETKKRYESTTTPSGDGNVTFDYNNLYYAQHGYAVLNYTSRGWGRSCGSAESREGTPGCEGGWVHASDQRYEARDTQYLLGLLADEHIVDPRKIGVTGLSNGGVQSIELAYLRNQIRLPNGQFAPWTSPKGKPMRILAAYPVWPWSDLVSLALPNGRFLDTEVAPSGSSREPLGVELQTWVTGFFEVAEGGEISGEESHEARGYYAPPGMDPDLRRWGAALGKGEPMTKEDEEIANQMYTYHQGYGLPGTPAPLLIESGWTDSLVSPKEALRVYNSVRAHKGKVALQLGDLGHWPASNKEGTDRYFHEEAAAFFAARVQHVGTAPASGKVTAFTQTCPKGEPGGGPFIATSWAKLHPHTISFGSPAAQTFTSAGGNATIAADYEPISTGLEAEHGGEGACKSVKAEEEPNTANYTMTSKGFTLMGLPTIKATIKDVGPFGEIAARLWDVTPGGQQRMISRGVWRIAGSEENATTTITFQLHGNGYEFPAGDTVKLQLLGRDAPYYRASNGTFTLEATNVTVTLPTT
jgi:X-Pro dipeptidyl-peptidase (S15 family)/X-Pro dipeptidyl-peptidase C-terminal non-catalytic domain